MLKGPLYSRNSLVGVAVLATALE